MLALSGTAAVCLRWQWRRALLAYLGWFYIAYVLLSKAERKQWQWS